MPSKQKPNKKTKSLQKQNPLKNKKVAGVMLSIIAVFGVITLVRTFASNIYLTVNLATRYSAADINFIAPEPTAVKTVSEPNGKKTTSVLELKSDPNKNQFGTYIKYRVNLFPGTYEVCVQGKMTALEDTSNYNDPDDLIPPKYGSISTAAVQVNNPGGKGGLPESLSVSSTYSEYCSASFEVTSADEQWDMFVSAAGTARFKDLYVRSASKVDSYGSGNLYHGLFGDYKLPAYTHKNAKAVLETEIDPSGQWYSRYEYWVELASNAEVTYTFTPNTDQVYNACYNVKSMAATGSMVMTVTDTKTGAKNTKTINATQDTLKKKDYCLQTLASNNKQSVTIKSTSGTWRAFTIDVKPL